MSEKETQTKEYMPHGPAAIPALDGASVERAAIVSWIRHEAAKSSLHRAHDIYLSLADAIKRGDHVKDQRR